MNWSIELPSGEFLDTPEDFNLVFELSNQVFSTSDTTQLPGSFSFPVEVPLTPGMRAQFNFPDRVDRKGTIQKMENVWARAGGVRLFSGTLKISRVGEAKVSLSIYADFLAGLKKANLPDIDYGADIATGGTSTAAWAAHMLATANNPEDFNHIFFPVYFTGGDKGWINKWWGLGGGGFDVVGSDAVAPYVKISHILDRIFSNADGYALTNAWQTDIEMTRRYLFHQSDAKILALNPALAPTLPATFSLGKHVPNVPVTRFLRALCAQNCLGIFTNSFNRTVRIAPLQSAIDRAVTHDWTRYAIGEPVIEVETDDQKPGYLNYEQPYDGLPGHFPPVESVQAVYNTRDDFNDDWQNLPTGYAYVEAGETMMEVLDDGSVVSLQRGHVLWRGAGDPSQSLIAPDGLVPLRAIEFGNDGMYSVHQGEPSFFQNSGGTYEWQQNDCPLSVLQYRGIQEQKAGETPAPLACNHVWLPYNTVVGTRSKIMAGGSALSDSEHSLNFFGEYGLYAQAWSRWFEMLQSGKPVTQSFLLPLTVLTGFSFEEKIRVGNMDFMVKKLRIQKLADRGRLEVEASLVTVI